MGTTPRFLFRKADTPAAGTHQSPRTSRIAALAMSTDNMRPHNLAVGGDGGANKYPAWSDTTTYTLSALSSAAVVEHDGKQWVLHTTQAAVGSGNAFPGTANWHQLIPLLECLVWGDVRKTSSAAATKATMNAWKAAGRPLRVYQYIYLPLAAVTGNHYDVPAAAWLDAQNAWLSTDNAVMTQFTKSCMLTSGSNLIACADTSNITVGMYATGTGIPARSMVSAINANVSVTLVDTVDGSTARNATTSGAQTLTFTNRTPQTPLFGGAGTALMPVLARVMEFKDGNGDTWPAWYAKQVAGLDATYADFPLRGVSCDDMVNTSGQRTAEGDPLNSNYSNLAAQNYFGYGYHRSAAREASTVTAARDAIQAGMAACWREIRRAVPSFRVMTNSGQSKRPQSGVWTGAPDIILLEGCGSYYSPEVGQAQVGWRSQFRIVKQFCEETCRSRQTPVFWHWKCYDDHDAADTAALPRTQPLHRDMRFGLASTLLTDAAYGFSYEYSSVLPEYSSETGRRLHIAEMDAPIGVPVESIPGDAGDGSGIWSRAYTNGLVVVRPKPSKADGNTNWATDPAITFTLPFDCVELTNTFDPEDQGRTLPAGSTISLLPRDARILLRA